MQYMVEFTVGNSDVVAIPSDVKKKTGISKGSNVYIYASEDNQSIIISKTKKQSKNDASQLSPEFVKWLEDFNNMYGEAMVELSKK